MSTTRLYYTDCYVPVFEARVVDKSEDGRRVYLDRTAFYPASGGQPHDLGFLGDTPVVEVIDEEDRIAHVLAAPIAADALEGRIDWERRYDHMQQHTGQHLLSAVFVELFAFQTVSFHLGSEVSTIELGAKDLSGLQIEKAEQRANEMVREARPVNIRFEDAQDAEGLRKPSAREGQLRIIEISDFDRSACGGTHVRSTAELGPILIRKYEKIRGNLRTEFVCGIRALRRARQDFRILAELARQAAAPIDQLPEYTISLRGRLTEAEKDRQRMALDLARTSGVALHQTTLPTPDGLRRALLRVNSIDDAVRAKVQAFTGLGKAIAIAVASEPAGILIACSPDSGFNAGSILKAALAHGGGRGGGSATLAQGSLPGREVLDSVMGAVGSSHTELTRASDTENHDRAGQKDCRKGE